MSGHAKGPWRVVVGDGSLGSPIVSVVDSEDTAVCDNEPYYPAPLNPDNAHLIAAAPCLLEALEGMMVCFDDGVGQPWNSKQLDAARAAIARAKGEQP